MILYKNSRLWCYVLCRWIFSAASSDPQISLQWFFRDHSRDIAQATSRKLRNSQDRNGDVSSKPRNLLDPLGLLFQTWDSLGVFWDDDLWSLSFRWEQIWCDKKDASILRQDQRTWLWRSQTTKLSELHMTCIPNTYQHIPIPQYTSIYLNIVREKPGFQYLLIWFGQSYYQAICQDDHCHGKVQPTQHCHGRHGVYPGNRGDCDHGSCHGAHRGPSSSSGPSGASHVEYDEPGHGLEPQAVVKLDPDMAMDQYLLMPFLEGWTSIYQLFWCSPGVQGFDTLPYFSNFWMTCNSLYMLILHILIHISSCVVFLGLVQEIKQLRKAQLISVQNQPSRHSKSHTLLDDTIWKRVK